MATFRSANFDTLVKQREERKITLSEQNRNFLDKTFILFDAFYRIEMQNNKTKKILTKLHAKKNIIQDLISNLSITLNKLEQEKESIADYYEIDKTDNTIYKIEREFYHEEKMKEVKLQLRDIQKKFKKVNRSIEQVKLTAATKAKTKL